MDNEIFFPKIKLEKLELRNYRGFPYLPSIKFDDNLTVIIGNNGSGKTTLLDGVAVFLQYFVYEIILGKSDYELSIQPKDIKNGTDAADLTAEFSVTFEFLEKETLAELSSIIKKLNNEWRYEYEGKNAELVFSEGDWYVSIDKNINYDLIPIETQLSLKNNNFLIAQHNGTKWELAVNHEVFVNEDRNLWNNNDYTDVNLKIELGYNRKSAKPIIKGNSELIEQLRISLRNHWEVKREPLPVFAYYGSSEISTKVTYIPDFRLSFEQVYSEVLSPATFSLNTIYNWFRSKQEIANHERKIKSEIAFNALGQEVANIRTNFEKLIEKSGENTPIPEMIENLLRKYEANIAEVEAGKQLNLVENVVLEMLTDETATYSDLQISFDSITKEAHLSIKKQMPHESEATALALNQLSSGEKHLLAIVADLAIRMIELNPKVANPLKEGEGIVIIDEIDTHLHPLWQQKVVTKLREVFANVEFVVTTHSPEVLKGLDRKHLRIVKNNSVTSKVPYIKGRDNNAILQDAFGIYERLPEYEKKLSQFYKYVENDKNQARKILDELTSDWGEMDTEIVRAESYFEIFLTLILMKYIDKQIKNEPQALRNFRNNTPNANYKGYTDKDIETSETHPLKNALLKEQGYLCAYCMGKISLTLNENNKPKIEVEHFKPQETHSKLDLSYMNMLGVCNGLSITHPEKEEMHHCDKTKGEYGKMNGKVELKKLNPCDKTCETLITYKADGEILAVNEDIDVKYDLENVLNLNNQALKDARKAIVDNARKNLMKEKTYSAMEQSLFAKALRFLAINK